MQILLKTLRQTYERVLNKIINSSYEKHMAYNQEKMYLSKNYTFLWPFQYHYHFILKTFQLNKIKEFLIPFSASSFYIRRYVEFRNLIYCFLHCNMCFFISCILIDKRTAHFVLKHVVLFLVNTKIFKATEYV